VRVLPFNLNVNSHEMNQLSSKGKGNVAYALCASKLNVGFALYVCVCVCVCLSVCLCMRINWSTLRNKMLLGEQLPDKVQVVAVSKGGS